MSEALPSKYQTGDLIDQRYRVVKLLGSGGMAEVYLAEDTQMHDRKIAVKLLFSHISLDQVNVERFIREVEVTQKHNHKNIVKSYHYGKTAKNEQYFTMEFIEGKSLAQIIKEKGKIDYKDALSYILQISDALSTAHKMGVIHRDIKPDNIILTNDNVIKITDFGIAKDLKTDQKLTDLEKGPKTFLYKAPELYVEEYDHRVDIYALGISIYEMLTGITPFVGEPHQLLIAHLTHPIPEFAGKKTGIPAEFQDLVEKCCAKDPKKRFSSADELIKFIYLHLSEHLTPSAAISGYSASSPIGKKVQKIIFQFERAFSRNTKKAFLYATCLIIAFLNMSMFIRLPFSPFVIGDKVDFALQDWLFQLRTPRIPPEAIKLVTINNETYKHYNFFTGKIFPRDKFAEFISFVSEQNPKAIILDYVFSKITDPSMVNPEADSKLALALKGSPTYIGRYLTIEKDKHFWDESDPLFKESAKGEFYGDVMGKSMIRKFNLGYATGGIPPIAKIVYGEDAKTQKLPNIDSLINYYGPPLTIPTHQFEDVLSKEEFKNDYFKDKYIIVGQVVRLGIGEQKRDTFYTPFHENMSGVEIHATTLGNILDQSWIKRLDLQTESFAILIFSILFTYFSLKLSAIWLSVITAISLIIWFAASYLFLSMEIFFPGFLFVIPLMPIVLAIRFLSELVNYIKRDRVLGV